MNGLTALGRMPFFARHEAAVDYGSVRVFLDAEAVMPRLVLVASLSGTPIQTTVYEIACQNHAELSAAMPEHHGLLVRLAALVQTRLEVHLCRMGYSNLYWLSRDMLHPVTRWITQHQTKQACTAVITNDALVALAEDCAMDTSFFWLAGYLLSKPAWVLDCSPSCRARLEAVSRQHPLIMPVLSRTEIQWAPIPMQLFQAAIWHAIFNNTKDWVVDWCCHEYIGRPRHEKASIKRLQKYPATSDTHKATTVAACYRIFQIIDEMDIVLAGDNCTLEKLSDLFETIAALHYFGYKTPSRAAVVLCDKQYRAFMERVRLTGEYCHPSKAVFVKAEEASGTMTPLPSSDSNPNLAYVHTIGKSDF